MYSINKILNLLLLVFEFSTSQEIMKSTSLTSLLCVVLNFRINKTKLLFK